MSVVTATYVKQNFGACVTDAQTQPLVINKSGKPSAVLMSYNEFMRLQELEDHLWALCAQEAAKEGYLGQEETTAFLKSRLEKIAH